MGVYIYGLVDPRSGQIRYVGKTIRTPRKRLYQHLALAKMDGSSAIGRWLIPLLEEGYRPDIVILEEVLEDKASESEISWIKRLHSNDHPLVNITHTGQTPPSTLEFQEQQRLALEEWLAKHPIEVRLPEAFGDDSEMTPEELRELRLRAGWSQARLAKAMGYDGSMICMWESGKRRIPTRARILIRSVLWE